ncbi:hypothetical protein [Bremerella cremea]|uniref:hypothetical protein n=1 Tax=Bremerella cremea TaxID=1031537 RepID=UPI0031F0E39B
MDNSYLLIRAMAKECQGVLRSRATLNRQLPDAMQPKHLIWMCNEIEKHAEDTPPTKLNRWIGYIQCAILAHGILDLDGLKAMFQQIKSDHGETAEDQEDLTDHLDPMSSFEFDIGGQG